MNLRRRLLYPFNYENKSRIFEYREYIIAISLETQASLHPDVALEAPSDIWLSQQILFIDTHIEYYIITGHLKSIYFFVCELIFHTGIIDDLAENAVLIALNPVWHKGGLDNA